MKNVNQEAENYAISKGVINFKARKNGFIAGTKSYNIKAKRIKAEIEGLVFAIETPSKVTDRITELEQKLKKLENENI